MRFGGRGGPGGRRFGGGPRFGGGRDRDFRDRRDDLPKPVKVGDEFDVEIKEMGSNGDGIARINNFVVFVKGAGMGEKPHIKITDVRNRFAIAEKTDGSSSTEEATEAPSVDDDEGEGESGEGNDKESDDEDSKEE
ncbi:MAG: TRAM domain-containing protein [Candidatus Aenigmarchaeota archaeon]|nr:TRAM domain-containing protein [Candidatus Aenigmarchaeota archaeon]